MEKYDLLPEQLLYEGTLEPSDFFHPQALSEQEILRTHTEEYWSKLKNGTLTQKEIRALAVSYTHLTLPTKRIV